MNRRVLWVSGVILLVLAIFTIWKFVTPDRLAFRVTDRMMNDMSLSGGAPVVPSEMTIMPVAGEISPYPPYDGETGSTGVLREGASRLLVKTGQMSVVVDSVEDKTGEFRKFVEEKKGFIVSSQVYDMDVSPRATIVLRVPASEFEGTIAHIHEIGVVKDESINGQDVTEEFIDLEAELKNYQATEAQFLEIMKKAQKIEDILSVQRELTNIRAVIERTTGRMKYLNESADYSTLTVYFSLDSASLPVLDSSNEWRPAGIFKSALRSLVELGKALISIIIWLVVYIPVWGVILLIIWYVSKRIRRSHINK